MRVAALLLQGLTFGPVAGVLHCGGATASLGTPPGDDVGNEAGPPVGEVPAQHRPAAVACASSSAGGVACNDDAECNGNHTRPERESYPAQKPVSHAHRPTLGSYAQ